MIVLATSVVKCTEGEIDGVFDCIDSATSDFLFKNKGFSICLEKHVDSNELMIKYIDLGEHIN